MELKNPLMVRNILYSVDPERLLINVSSVKQINQKHCCTTTHENFSLENDQTQIQFSLDKSPFEVNGLLYFQTEDEAKGFVKTQIGM